MTDMSFLTAKNIMWHWKNNTKESETITFGDVMKAESLVARVNANRQRMSRVFITAGLVLLVASQVLRIM